MIEAIRHIEEYESWGDRQSKPILEATSHDYEKLIRTGSSEDLRAMFHFFEPIENGRWAGSSFAPAAKLFFAAVVGIVKQGGSSRSALVLTRALRGRGLGKLLDPL